MRNTGFLKKLAREHKISILEPSKNLTRAYLNKAQDCYESAALLRTNRHYQNSIIMSYYAMYNSITSILYMNGIKSSNHSGTIMLFDLLYEEKEICDIIIGAKKSRVENQYSPNKHNEEVMSELSEELIMASGMIIRRIKTLIQANKQDDTEQRRKTLLKVLNVSNDK
ncbi:MAG: HEPN domain-containing protein [Candidatus Woesearchaeota archaeon]